MAFPCICLPDSSKNSRLFELQLFELQLFESISIPLGANYSLNHPKLFELFLLGGSSSENIDFLQLKHFFSSKNQFSICMAIYTLQSISSKVQYSPSVQIIEANRETFPPHKPKQSELKEFLKLLDRWSLFTRMELKSECS